MVIRIGKDTPTCVCREFIRLPCRVSVSRAIKPIVEADGSRPSEYFSQKNCAQQYSSMLDKAGTHKRKRSTAEGTSEAGVLVFACEARSSLSGVRHVLPRLVCNLS